MDEHGHLTWAWWVLRRPVPKGCWRIHCLESEYWYVTRGEELELGILSQASRWVSMRWWLLSQGWKGDGVSPEDHELQKGSVQIGLYQCQCFLCSVILEVIHNTNPMWCLPENWTQPSRAFSLPSWVPSGGIHSLRLYAPSTATSLLLWKAFYGYTVPLPAHPSSSIACHVPPCVYWVSFLRLHSVITCSSSVSVTHGLQECTSSMWPWHSFNSPACSSGSSGMV